MDILNYDVLENILNFCDIDTINNFMVAFPDMKELTTQALRKHNGITQYLKLKKIREKEHIIYCSCGQNIVYSRYISHLKKKYHITDHRKTQPFYKPTPYELLYDYNHGGSFKGADLMREVRNTTQYKFIYDHYLFIRNIFKHIEYDIFEDNITIETKKATLSITVTIFNDEDFIKFKKAIDEKEEPITILLKNKYHVKYEENTNEIYIYKVYNK